jgi:ADP-ribose pyrophosphatase
VSADYTVVRSEPVYDGALLKLRVDTLRMSDGSEARREIVDHPGAVSVAALDDQDRIVLVNQYRHAVRQRVDELPAGLLDVDGEDPLAAAHRELAEEAGLAAGRWNVLLDLYSSPGFSDEAVRVYLARDLREASPGDDFVAEDEEVAMEVHRMPLDEAVRRALAGEISNSSSVAGVLAVDHARRAGYVGLRAADAPWPRGAARR